METHPLFWKLGNNSDHENIIPNRRFAHQSYMTHYNSFGRGDDVFINREEGMLVDQGVLPRGGGCHSHLDRARSFSKKGHMRPGGQPVQLRMGSECV